MTTENRHKPRLRWHAAIGAEVGQHPQGYADPNNPGAFQSFMSYKNKEDAIEWRSNHKESKKIYDKERNQCAFVREKSKQNKQSRLKTLQQYIIDYLLLHPCVDCKESDIVVLDFDHVQSKTIGVSRAVSRGWSLAKLKAEISKCEVRCANCHRRKTSKTFNWYRGLVK